MADGRPQWTYRPRFRIATLLWLMLAAACFFAGRYWDELGDAVDLAPTRPGVKKLVLRAGKPRLFERPTTIQSLTILDPDVLDASPVSPTAMQLRGRAEGTTELQAVFADGTTQVFSVKVRP